VNDQRVRVPSALERQRDEIVQHVIRWQGFDDRPGCYACESHLTARMPDGRRSCPWHWPVTQLVLAGV